MKVVWHEGTGTYMAWDECILVDVPDDILGDDIEEWLEENA